MSYYENALKMRPYIEKAAASLSDKEALEEWPAWVQPTGAHDAYAAGSKVSHAGKHWVSNVDANTWQPGVYGWTEVQ